jgi:hypothetical protein
MPRKIGFEFPDIETKFSATLLDEKEPDQCEALWKVLNKPVKMICQHTLSTGDYFGAYGRPPRHIIKTGSQVSPVGAKTLMLSQLEPGSVLYKGGSDLSVAYGPDITEPLAAPGPVIAKVDEEDLQDLWRVGRSVWNAQYMTHRLVTLTVKTEE